MYVFDTSVCAEALPYVEGERVGVVPGLLHQGVVHDAQLGLVALRVDLDLFVPDVLPERQANHVQVLTAIAEGAGQLHEHCHQQTTTDGAVVRRLGFELEVGFHVSVPELVSDVTFPAPEVFGVQLHNPICKHVKLITDLMMACCCT